MTRLIAYTMKFSNDYIYSQKKKSEYNYSINKSNSQYHHVWRGGYWCPSGKRHTRGAIDTSLPPRQYLRPPVSYNSWTWSTSFWTSPLTSDKSTLLVDYINYLLAVFVYVCVSFSEVVSSTSFIVTRYFVRPKTKSI